MKIVHVTNFFKPSWESGGVTRVAYHLTKELAKKGHEVVVLTTDGFKRRLNVGTDKPVIVDGIKVYYFRNLSIWLTSKNIIIPLKSKNFIQKEIADCDVVHIHGHRSLLAHLAAKAALKYDKPYLIQPHGSLPYEIGKKRYKRIFDKVLGNKIIHRAKTYIALNETEKEQFSMFDIRDNIEIIPNGVDIYEFKNLPKRGIFKNKYKIPKDFRIILYVGRIHRSKGIDLIVMSFKKLISEGIKARLVIIGPDDGYKEELKSMITSECIEKEVYLLGFIPEEDKIPAYVDADVFVTPRFSGFPMTFLESCACGTPIITTKKGDKLKWINNKVGIVLNYDYDEISSKIIDLFENKEKLSNMENNCKKIIREKYNWNEISKSLEKIYNKN